MEIILKEPSILPAYNTSTTLWATLKRAGAKNAYTITDTSTCREEYTKYLIKDSFKLPKEERYKYIQDTIMVGLLSSKYIPSLAYVTNTSSLAVKHLNLIEAKYGWPLSKLVTVTNELETRGIDDHTLVKFVPFAIKPSKRWLKSTHTLSLFLLIIRNCFRNESEGNTDTYESLVTSYINHKWDSYLRLVGSKHTELFSNWKILFNGLSKVAFDYDVNVPMNIHMDGVYRLLNNTCVIPIIPKSKISKYLKVKS